MSGGCKTGQLKSWTLEFRGAFPRMQIVHEISRKHFGLPRTTHPGRRQHCRRDSCVDLDVGRLSLTAAGDRPARYASRRCLAQPASSPSARCGKRCEVSPTQTCSECRSPPPDLRKSARGGACQGKLSEHVGAGRDGRPAAKCAAVAQLQAVMGLSERRACDRHRRSEVEMAVNVSKSGKHSTYGGLAEKCSLRTGQTLLATANRVPWFDADFHGRRGRSVRAVALPL